MRNPPRGLSVDEAVLWQRLSATVKPMHIIPSSHGELAHRRADGGVKTVVVHKPTPPEPLIKVKGRIPPPRPAPAPAKPPHAPGLDSHWERRLARTSTSPDFTLDLHGHTLDQAHSRLDAGLSQARIMGARLVLVITGKSRPVDAADRGDKRGAIRAKILDWLAAGSHASAIAAVRPAHRRHGGEGAIYLVLRR